MSRVEQLPLFPAPGRPAEAVPPLVALPDLGADPSLAAAAGAFEEHMRRQGFTPNTMKAFRSDLGLLAQYLSGGTPVRRIGTRRLEDFLHWLLYERQLPCNAKSFARRLTTLKVFFKWLTDVGVLREDPAAALIHQPTPSRLPDILYDDQVEALLDVAAALRDPAERPDSRPYLLLSLLLATGIKKGECMGIALEHIDLKAKDGPTLYVRYANPRQQHKERKVRLPADFGATLAVYRAQYNPRARLFECTARNLEYVLTDLAQRAALPDVSFEVLRMTAAVRDYKAGMAPEVLRQKLGLSSITWADTGEKIRRLAGPPL